jgi:hypothetical protein
VAGASDWARRGGELGLPWDIGPSEHPRRIDAGDAAAAAADNDLEPIEFTRAN